MKYSQMLVLLHLVSLAAFAKNHTPAPLTAPLYFERNIGQFPGDIRFAVRGPGLTAWLTSRELLLPASQAASDPPLRIAFSRHPASSAAGIDPLPGVSSYFSGADPSKWIRNAPSFGKAKLIGIAPGIDVVFHAPDSGAGLIEYDFVLNPGADLSALRVDFDPRMRPRLDPANPRDILLDLAPGVTVRHRVPLVHQQGRRVAWKPKLSDDGWTLRFEVPDYDRNQPLVIDPLIVYNVTVQGNYDAVIKAIAADAAGAVYVAGSANGDAFVTKISATPVSGQYVRLYSIFFGSPTSPDDVAMGIAIDSSGAAYVAGQTRAADFPMKAASLTTFSGGTDGFVAKIGATPGPDGYELVYSSYVGAEASRIAVDSMGAAYVAGSTFKTTLPVLNAMQQQNRGGNSDGFVVKISSAPVGGVYPRVYATYLGGIAETTLKGIAVDSSGAAYVCGWTGPDTFLLADPNLNVDTDPFVLKIAGSPAPGSGIYETAWAKRFLTFGTDGFTGIALDRSGNTYLTGITDAFNWPLVRPIAGSSGNNAVVKLAATPDSSGAPPVLFSTRFGGTGARVNSVAVDASGGIYLSGAALNGSSSFPSVDPTYSADGSTGFAVKMQVPDQGDGVIAYSTVVDGQYVEDGMWAATDGSGNMYLAGTTFVNTFPGIAKRGVIVKLAPTPGGVRVTFHTSPAQGQVLLVIGGGCQPGEYRTPVTLNWTPGATCYPSVLRTITDAPGGKRYEFKTWTDSFPDPMRTLIAGTADASYTAVFTTQVAVKLAVDNPARGTVTSPQGYYSPGEVATIRAAPAFGYAFVRWTGTANIERYAAQVTTVTVGTEPVNLTANFAFTGASGGGSQFVPVRPCRVIDTRAAGGGGPVAAKGTREFDVAGVCGVPPSGVTAYSLNLTVVPKGPLGYVTLFPSGQTQPVASTLNSLDGRVKANAALVSAGVGGKVSVYATDATDVVLDINGYFVAGAPPGSLAYYPVTPCRLVDTRTPSGGGKITAQSTRMYGLWQVCGVPSTALAFALNATVIPQAGPLGYLRIQPSGGSGATSTLNAVTGTVVANTAIVTANTFTGAIDVYATEDTHLVLDVYGYFAPPDSQAGGLQFYPQTSPCRILDTRLPGSAVMAAGTSALVGPEFNGCALPRGARVLSLNATVIPQRPVFGYLTLYPPDLAGGARPIASILNAVDGALTSNAALVEAALSQIGAYVSDAAHLVLDLNGVFAP